MNSLYRGQVVNDNLVYIGEFQPHSEEFNPIRGDEIMESYIFQNSLDSISNVKKYHIGQVTQSADELMEEMNVTLVRHVRSISFGAKPWRYAWNEDKSKEKEIKHSFIISILQPYSHPAHDGSCCLKVIEQFQSPLFEISSQRRGRMVNFVKNDITAECNGHVKGSSSHDDMDDDDDDELQHHHQHQQQQHIQTQRKQQVQTQRKQQQKQHQEMQQQHGQSQILQQQHLQQQQLLHQQYNHQQLQQHHYQQQQQQQPPPQQQQQGGTSLHMNTVSHMHVPNVHVSNLQSSPSSNMNGMIMSSTGASDKKTLKFCHSFSDGNSSSNTLIDNNSFDEHVFDNLELLSNVSFRMMKHSDSAVDIFSDQALFPLVELDYMDVSDEDEDNPDVCIVDGYNADI